MTVSLPIIADRRFDPDERFSLELTVPDEFSNTNGSLLIKPGSNNVAVGEIIDPSGMYMHARKDLTNTFMYSSSSQL